MPGQKTVQFNSIHLLVATANNNVDETCDTQQIVLDMKHTRDEARARNESFIEYWQLLFAALQ